MTENIGPYEAAWRKYCGDTYAWIDKEARTGKGVKIYDFAEKLVSIEWDMEDEDFQGLNKLDLLKKRIDEFLSHSKAILDEDSMRALIVSAAGMSLSKVKIPQERMFEGRTGTFCLLYEFLKDEKESLLGEFAPYVIYNHLIKEKSDKALEKIAFEFMESGFGLETITLDQKRQLVRSLQPPIFREYINDYLDYTKANASAALSSDSLLYFGIEACSISFDNRAQFIEKGLDHISTAFLSVKRIGESNDEYTERNRQQLERTILATVATLPIDLCFDLTSKLLEDLDYSINDLTRLKNETVEYLENGWDPFEMALIEIEPETVKTAIERVIEIKITHEQIRSVTCDNLNPSLGKIKRRLI